MTLRVELLIIGNEILSGHTLDTNSQWLAQRLFELALPVNQIQVIEDRVDLIATAIQDSHSRDTTVLVTSGGLGPTFDDITAEGLAQAVGTTLELHPLALEIVTNRYKTLKSQNIVETAELTPARKKMALLPKGATPLPNSVGSAPGIQFHFGQTQIYCLPGVPEELYAMFMAAVAPQIASLTNTVVLQEIIQVPILDESKLAPLIDSVMKNKTGIYIKSLPRPYQSRKPLRVAITVNAKTKRKAKSQLEEISKDLLKITQLHRQT
ncbi:MAG: competence/damage-inducible protein A [Candidatus Hermodarchaeota archaeon]